MEQTSQALLPAQERQQAWACSQLQLQLQLLELRKRRLSWRAQAPPVRPVQAQQTQQRQLWKLAAWQPPAASLRQPEGAPPPAVAAVRRRRWQSLPAVVLPIPSRSAQQRAAAERAA
jgi:hypothetical protein